jgi:hypothetical protein
MSRLPKPGRCATCGEERLWMLLPGPLASTVRADWDYICECVVAGFERLGSRCAGELRQSYERNRAATQAAPRGRDGSARTGTA